MNPTSSTPASVDLVVVTFNARDDVLRCLASVHAHPPERPWRLRVVDNASSDGTPDAISVRWPDVDVTRLPRNVGFAAANNRGVAAGSSPLVLLLNSDTVTPPGQLEALCARLEAEPQAGVVGPRLEDGDGQPELSFGSMIGPWAELVQKTRGQVLACGPAWWRRHELARLARPQHVDWVSGACLLTRRRVFQEVGGLDERYFMYAEDVDFCAAVRHAGHSIRYAPDIRMVHLRGRSRATAASATAAHYRRSQVAFYEKHHPRWAPLLRAYLRVRGVGGKG